MEMMHALIEAGARPKLKAQDGTTLLIAAAGSGHVEVVQYAYEPFRISKRPGSRAAVLHSALTGTIQSATPEEICAVIDFLAKQRRRSTGSRRQWQEAESPSLDRLMARQIRLKRLTDGAPAGNRRPPEA